MGAPAGGINAATRAAVRYCLHHGHTPLAVHNGFLGLIGDSPTSRAVLPLSWLGVDTWMVRGGSELGTNRTQPDVDLGAVAAKFQEYGFGAVIMLGGFDAFESLMILEAGRKHYPALHIPMVHLPATISNKYVSTASHIWSATE